MLNHFYSHIILKYIGLPAIGCWLLLLHTQIMAQVGGDNAFEFLNLNADARTAAMGGTYISVFDNDLSTALQNPALLNHEMNNKLSLSATDYFADIKYGNAAFAKHIRNTGTFAAGVKYIDYGEFNMTDEFATNMGTFHASEYAIQLSYASPFRDSNFTFGFNVKAAMSQLADMRSSGVAADAGVAYHNNGNGITASILIKNVGIQLRAYSGSAKENLPFEIQAGISKKLKRAPFRFNLNIHNLQTYDLTYPASNATVETDPQTGLPIVKKTTSLRKMVLHCVPGVELLLSKNFHLRASYNFQRRNELGIATAMKAVGLSFGIGLRLSKFNFSYGRSIYHLAGATNHFTVAVDMDDFYRKK